MRFVLSTFVYAFVCTPACLAGTEAWLIEPGMPPSKFLLVDFGQSPSIYLLRAEPSKETGRILFSVVAMPGFLGSQSHEKIPLMNFGSQKSADLFEMLGQLSDSGEKADLLDLILKIQESSIQALNDSRTRLLDRARKRFIRIFVCAQAFAKLSTMIP